jgi:hypothetical protein
MLIGGGTVSLLAHVMIPGLAAIVLSSFGMLAADTRDTSPTIAELHVIEARFVQLGEKRDPRKLPNRRVPRKTTAPDKSIAVSKNPRDHQAEEEKRPEDAEDDLLTRLGDRAKAFAEIAEEREREGDPEGVEWGSATEAREGDIFAGKLRAFFHRGWSVPSTLDAETVRTLVTAVLVQISVGGEIGRFRIVRTSGEPLFDASVIERLTQLRAQGEKIPEPPPAIAHQFLGQEIRVHFQGRNAR